jgi:predicted acyl esterase
MDQRPVEKRQDVLVYTTPQLTADLEVTGAIRLILYAASSSLDTDFTAKLVDVFPSGEARNLTDGIIRAVPGVIGAAASDSTRRAAAICD